MKNSMVKSIGTLGFCITIASLAAVLSTPLTAVAYTAATQACKDCVTKCVMTDGKTFSVCETTTYAMPQGTCNAVCPDVDRNGLKVDLKTIATAKCTSDYNSCKTAAQGDATKIANCGTAYDACLVKTQNFYK